MTGRELLQQAFVLTLIVLLLTGCGGAPAEPTATPVPPTATSIPTAEQAPKIEFTPTIEYTSTPEPTITPEPTNTPTLIPTPIGGGGKLVFHSQTDNAVYTLELDGNEITKLFDTPDDSYGFSWSPDKELVAFVINHGERNNEIYVMRADGTEVTRLTENTHDDRSLEWSPDGKLIIFMSNRDGPSLLYKMNHDGSSPERITSGVKNYYSETNPSISPDGQLIAYSGLTRNEEKDTLSIDIWLMNLEGTDFVRLTDTIRPIDNAPSIWSPDGKWITYSSNQADPDIINCGRNCVFQVFIMRSDGTDLQQVTESQFSSHICAWSLYENSIAVVEFQDGEYRNRITRIINLDDGGTTTLETDDVCLGWWP